MAIKVKGVFARPGRYKYGDHYETKTKDELKAGAERQPIIMLTKGHPAGGIPRAEDFIGTVSQKWNPNTEEVDLDAWFWEERIDPELSKRLQDGSPVPFSPGYRLSKIDPDGTQRGYFYTHTAVVDNPLIEGVGVNIRAESENQPASYIRQDAPLIRKESKEPEKASEPVEAESEAAFTAKQLEQLQGLIDAAVKPKIIEKEKSATVEAVETPKPKETVEPKPEKTEKPDVKPSTEAEVLPPPETIIPKGTSATDAYKQDEDGCYTHTPKAQLKKPYPKNTPGVV